ncbi:MAG: prepilin-type N-terminal cleavage/methylation domain-containing protein [Patescibacteria group bacterium]
MRGLTLIEILLVMALVVVISAGGIAGLSQLQAVFKLRGAADEIRAALQLGRELAIANKDQETYQISLAFGIVILRSNAGEIVRYMSPAGITYSPSSFGWGFTPLTGQLTGCPLPCQLTLTSGENVELVIFQTNGIVN